MPMTVKVGLARKVGQPDFGSLGASCDIELELDGSLLFHNLDGLQDKVRAAYLACRQAVNDELASQRAAPTPVTRGDGDSNDERQTGANGHSSTGPTSQNPERGHGIANSQVKNGSPAHRDRRAATRSQVRALHAIATRQGFILKDRLLDRFNLYRAEDLSVAQASLLIEDLNGGSIAASSHGSGAQA
jgi:hypothetical protein